MIVCFLSHHVLMEEHWQQFSKVVFSVYCTAYVEVVKEEMPSYETEARQLAKIGDMQKAQMMLTKKKMAEKEVSEIFMVTSADTAQHQSCV